MCMCAAVRSRAQFPNGFLSPRVKHIKGDLCYGSEVMYASNMHSAIAREIVEHVAKERSNQDFCQVFCSRVVP